MISFQEQLADKIYTNPDFKRDFGDFLKSQFPPPDAAENTSEQFEHIKLKRLIESALIMASSPSEKHKKAALELSTIFYERILNEFPAFNGVMKLICTRLGNFPGVNLLDENIESLPLGPQLESNAYILENTVQIEDKLLKLTKFQRDSFELISRGHSVSLSAPTSAGKTFLITQFIASKFLKEDRYNVAIIVPTRALIRQLARDFHSTFNSYHIGISGKNGVDFITSSVEYVDKHPARKQVFIVTQERLQAILYNWENVPKFNLLVIDESQKIGDANRGIILEDTIAELINTQRDLQCIFLSPFSSNPAFLFELLDISSQSTPLETSLSPVAQHIYSVTIKKGSRKRIHISKIESGIGEFAFEIRTKESMPNSRPKRLAFAVKQLGNNLSTILYANGPVEAENIALSLADEYKHIKSTSQEVAETVDYLKSIIHEEYYLVKCLEKGVGYHYGAMPEIAKISVEELFRNELIPYVSCTSTLLEGVNLPAKNIFIEEPKLGKIPMDDSSFWNLAGRAGRLMRDFSGNIYCILQDQWDKPVSQRKRRYKIESSLTRTLNEKFFIQYCTKVSGQINRNSYEQATNNLVLKHKESGPDIVRTFITDRVSSGAKEQLFRASESLASSITLPLELLKKNKSIDFRFQQVFIEYLSKLPNRSILNLVPRNPFSPDAYENLQAIFSLTDKYFTVEDRGERYKYFTVIAKKWITEAPLRRMIESSINYNRKKGATVDVNKIIRDLVNALNNEIRFYYVRNVKCFCDLLNFDLSNRSISAEQYPLYTDFGLPNYLELGMFNIGTIQLHNLGLSRTTSIEVNNFCKKNGVEGDEVVTWVKERFQVIAQRLAHPLKVELLRVFD